MRKAERSVLKQGQLQPRLHSWSGNQAHNCKMAYSSKKRSARGQNVHIRTVDVIRCVQPSSHHGSWEEQAKEWDVFALPDGLVWWAAKTPLTKRALSCMFLKEVRRAQCEWFVQWHRSAKLQSDEFVRVKFSPFRTKSLDLLTAFKH